MMRDTLEALLAAGAVPSTSFVPTSRYVEVAVLAYDSGDGTPRTPYLARRICPLPTRFETLFEVRTIDSDRRDLLAARHIGDAELWWRLADANGVIDPRALTESPGTVVRVTLAIDIPGSPDD